MDAIKARPLKVLLIEDNPADVRFVQEMLRGMDSHTLLHETRLDAGLARLAEEAPDIVLLDLGLPDSQGLDTIRRVGSRSDTVPIVVLTGLEDASVGLDSLKLGAQEYLIKARLTETALARVIHYSIERKQLEVRARESEKLYRLISENSTDVIWLLNLPGRKLSFVSPSLERLTGYVPSNLPECPPEGAIEPDARRHLVESIRQRILALQAGDESQRVGTDRLQFIHKDGHLVPTETVTTLVTDAAGTVTQVLGVSRAISDRIRLEEDRQNISDLYATLSHANEAMIHAGSEEELLEATCRVCVQYGLFDLAWIGAISADGSHVEARASYGPIQQHVQGLRIPLGTDAAGAHGPTARCIEENRPVIVPDWEEDSNVESWKARAYSFGIRSSAAFPVGRGGQAVRVLNLYSRARDFFKPDRIALLQDLATNLAYALEYLENEARKQRAEEALAGSEARFRRIVNGALEGIWTLDGEGRTVVVNPRLCEMLRYTQEELMGRMAADFLDPEAPPLEREGPGAAAPERFETRVLRKDGTRMDVRVSAAPIRDASGAPLGTVAMLMDISEEVQRRREREDSVALLSLLNTRGTVRELLEDVTSYLKRWSGCEAVGIRMKEGDDFPYFETQGFPEDFLKAERHLCARGADGKPCRDANGNLVLECMCGDVICGRFDPFNPSFTPRGSFWTNSTSDLEADPKGLDMSRFTRGLCISRGYESLALVPLQSGLEVQGLIQLNDMAKGRFSLDRIRFLERLADQIAMALGQRQAQENLRLLLDSTGEAIYGIDLEGHCTFCNPACVRAFGFRDAGALLGKNVHEIVHHHRPDGSPYPREECPGLLAASSGEAFHAMEETLWRADGTPFPTEYWSYPQRSGKGVVGAVVHFVDITERKRDEANLAASERRYRDLVETMSDWVWEVDENDVYTYCSPRVRDLLGYEPQELLGRSPTELMPPGEAERIAAVYAEAVAARKPLESLENVNVRKDGREVVLETSGVPVFDINGAFKGYRGIDRDITERKRAEREALEQFKLAEAFFNHSMNCLVVLDRDFNFIRVNEAYAKACGMEIRDFQGRNHFEMYPSDAQAIFEEVVRTKIPFTAIARPFVFPDHPEWGTTYWDWTLVPILDPRGEVEFLVFSLNEVTARKQAEEALRWSEESYRRQAELYQLAQRATQDVIWDWDLATDRTVWGESVQPMLGYAPQEVGSGPEWHIERVHPEDRERVSSGVRAAIARGESAWSCEYRFQRNDGTYAHVLDRGYLVRDADGKAVRMIGAMSDLTERIRAEQAQAASQAKSEFLATMTHEIRTPMIGMMGMLEILSHSELDADQRGALETIESSTRALLRIIGDILDFSKIEAGKLELAPQAVSLRQLLEETFGNYAAAGAQKGLRMECEVDPGLAPAHLADPVRFAEIIGNFLSNAVKFTSEGSVRLMVEVLDSEDSSQRLAFRVADTGIGISTEAQERLFQPFVQGESSTTRRFGGTGLGLAISQRLAQMMGGAITLESQVGAGTAITFAAEFPVAAAAALLGQAGALAWTPMIPPERSVAEAAKSLVLLVEDHPINRLVLSKQLRMAGYQVDPAEDGFAALQAMRGTAYGLVLTDIQMPGMDGRELAREIRKRESETGAPRTPVLAITASALKGELERCLDAGMDDCIIKPVGISELGARLRKWLPAAAGLMRPQPAEVPKEAEEGPLLDLAFLETLSKGSPTGVTEILKDFLASTRTDLEGLRAALALHNQEEVGRRAHRIKGSSRLVGAKILADPAQDLEEAARSGQEEIGGHMDRVQAAFARLEQYIGSRSRNGQGELNKTGRR